MNATSTARDDLDWSGRFASYLELRIAYELHSGAPASGRAATRPARPSLRTGAAVAARSEELRDQLNARRESLFSSDLAERSARGDALLAIRTNFALDDFELFTLALCLCVEIDARFANACAALLNDSHARRPDAALALRLFQIEACDFVTLTRLRARLTDAGALFRAGLLRREGTGLRVEDRVLSCIADDASLPAPGAVAWDLTRDAGGAVELSGFSSELIARLRSAWQSERQAGCRGSITWLEGATGPERRLAALAIAELNQTALLSVDLRNLAGGPELRISAGEADARIRQLAREAVLQNAALCITHGLQRDDSADEGLAAAVWQAFERCTREWRLHVIFCDLLSPEAPVGVARQRIRLEPANETARRNAWLRALQSLAEFPSALVAEAAGKLAANYRLSPAQIPTVVESLAGAGDELSPRDIERAARARTRHNIGSSARRIPARRKREDLVLPQAALEHIDEICNRVRQRGRVLEEWGFGRRASYGRGVTALFVGPPGVGKTLAAEAIASAAGLDLYRVDLAGVVSKYIGETEKNLARIFRETAATDAVLFFDEADALFGKRSEINDARDRYANIETSYLLQKIEESEGVILLASNLRENIDPAFVRRLDHIVEFPYPDLEARERLWRALLPAEVPQRGIDHGELARRLPLAGGALRNIALSAAYLAAGNGCVLTMDHILAGARREYAKLGKLWQEDRV